MAARVTDSEVKAVVDTARDTTPFIETANLLVNEVVVPNSDASADMLKQVELYLAAHFVAITQEKGNITEQQTGQARERYQNAAKEGIRLTRYGQMAITMDTSGALHAYSSPASQAVFRVV